MKNRIEMALEHDTPLTRAVAAWWEICDYTLERRDEAMALCWIIERVLLVLAGLWCQSPRCVGDCLYGPWLLPLVVLARRKTR